MEPISTSPKAQDNGSLVQPASAPIPLPLPSQHPHFHRAEVGPETGSKIHWGPPVALMAVACIAAGLFAVFRPTFSSMEISTMEAEQRASAWPSQNLQVASVGVDSISVKVWDDCSEDGDVVAIRSGPVTQTVNLTNKGVTLTFPRPIDGKLYITGVRDGVGGITLGLQGNGGEIHTPVMQPGQTINISVH